MITFANWIEKNVILTESIQSPYSKEYKKRFAMVVQKDLEHMDSMKRQDNKTIIDDIMAKTWEKMNKVIEQPDTDDLEYFVNKVNEIMNGGSTGVNRFVNNQYFPNLSKFMAREGNKLSIPLDMQKAIEVNKDELQSLFVPGISSKRRQMISQMLQMGLSPHKVKMALHLIDQGHPPHQALSAVK